MNINQPDRDKLLNFLGYGNLDAPFWFLGMEEGTGGEDNIQPNIEARLKFTASVMDMQEAHKYLNWPYWSTDENEYINKFPSVWIYMARFVRAIGEEQANDWWDTEKAKDYIRTSLGRKLENAQTFLSELLPLAKPRAAHWNDFYQETMGFDGIKNYREIILPARKQVLNQLIQEHSPKYLLCYGSSNFAHYKDLVEVNTDNWLPLDNNKFEIAIKNKTCIILSPFMGNGRVGRESFTDLINHLRKSE